MDDGILVENAHLEVSRQTYYTTAHTLIMTLPRLNTENSSRPLKIQRQEKGEGETKDALWILTMSTASKASYGQLLLKREANKQRRFGTYASSMFKQECQEAESMGLHFLV